MPRTEEISVGLPVLAFTIAVAIVAVFIFGLAPLAQVSERNLANWIRGAGQRAIRGGGQALRKGLVITEIALAVILVIGSGLMIRAFWKLQQVKAGFDPAGVVSFSLNLPPAKYKAPERLQFVDALEQKLSTIPSVTTVSLASGLPPLRRINANDTEIEGTAHPESRRRTSPSGNVVGTDSSRR